MLKLFSDSFPGGSITGAPKIRAMEIIRELEDHNRELYCGSVVYFSFNRSMDSNIAIRTVMMRCRHMGIMNPIICVVWDFFHNHGVWRVNFYGYYAMGTVIMGSYLWICMRLSDIYIQFSSLL